MDKRMKEYIEELRKHPLSKAVDRVVKELKENKEEINKGIKKYMDKLIKESGIDLRKDKGSDTGTGSDRGDDGTGTDRKLNGTGRDA